MLKLSACIGVWITFCAAITWADTHYVSLNGTNDSAGGYTNWAGSATQIQWAVNVATNGETVLVSNGIYYLTNQITITNSITLKSFSGSYTNTVINGNYFAYTNRGVYINNSGAVLDGFTITNCFLIEGYGGGVSADLCKLITNCLITGNTVTGATWHGAAGGYVNNGYVSHCSFIGNKNAGPNSQSAGLFFPSSIASNCIISANVKGASGDSVAFWGSYTSVTGVNCMISGNIGPGVGMDYATCLLSCIVSNNTENGINLNSGRIRNCLVIQNAGRGITISRWSGNNIEIDNCTIANNGGYGVYQHTWYVLSNPQYAANCIIYNNAGGNWGFDGTNIIYTNCCTIPIPTNIPDQLVGTGNITNAPLFANTNIANYRLSANSPCINAGTNRSWMTNAFDLDRKQRVRYGIVDMGAYEKIYDGAIFSVR